MFYPICDMFLCVYKINYYYSLNCEIYLKYIYSEMLLSAKIVIYTNL